MYQREGKSEGKMRWMCDKVLKGLVIPVSRALLYQEMAVITNKEKKMDSSIS